MAVSALVSQSLVFTAFAEPPEGFTYEYDLEVSPELIFDNSDFSIQVTLDEDQTLSLPQVEWPDFEGDVEDWAAANPDEADELNDAIYAEFDAGKDYLSFYLWDTDTGELVYNIPILVEDNPLVTVEEDGFRLDVPGGEDYIDLAVGDYEIHIFGLDKNDDYTYGNATFEVYEFEIIDISSLIDIDDLFSLPGDEEDEDLELGELEPGSIQISPEFVEGGEEVIALVSDVSSPDVLMVLPEEGWEIRVVTEFNEVLVTTDDDSIQFTADGYAFLAPDELGEYEVQLYNTDSGTAVDSVVLTVEDEDESAFDGSDLELVIELPDMELPGFGDLFDDAGEDEDVDVEVEEAGEEEEADAEDDSENVVDETLCDDTPLAHWGLEYINPLLDEGLYPVIEDGVGITCRPDEVVLRKEFTVWLLQAYLPDEFAAVDADTMGESPFTDLDEDDPYTPYIIKAAELEIISGHPDGSFKPDDEINRAEVLKILLRSAGLFFSEDDDSFESLVDSNSLNLENYDPTVRFSDVSVEDWFYRYLYYAVIYDIIEGYGDGEAKMGQGVRYAEAAKILKLTRDLDIEDHDEGEEEEEEDDDDDGDGGGGVIDVEIELSF